MSKVLAYYHIVFCTKERRMTLPLEQCEHLYRFIWKVITNHNCKLIRIGGIQNHIHILLELHPNTALSPLIQKIKSHSSGWLKKDNRFPDFDGWAKEYFASSISASHKDAVIKYIKNQLTHHLGTSFDDELQTICHASGQVYDCRDMR